MSGGGGGQDKEDAVVKPLTSLLDVAHALALLALRFYAPHACRAYPVVMLARQVPPHGVR